MRAVGGAPAREPRPQVGSRVHFWFMQYGLDSSGMGAAAVSSLGPRGRRTLGGSQPVTSMAQHAAWLSGLWSGAVGCGVGNT